MAGATTYPTVQREIEVKLNPSDMIEQIYVSTKIDNQQYYRESRESKALLPQRKCRQLYKVTINAKIEPATTPLNVKTLEVSIKLAVLPEAPLPLAEPALPLVDNA